MKGVKVDEIDIWSLLVQFLNQQLAIASDGSDRPKDQKVSHIYHDILNNGIWVEKKSSYDIELVCADTP